MARNKSGMTGDVASNIFLTGMEDDWLPLRNLFQVWAVHCPSGVLALPSIFEEET